MPILQILTVATREARQGPLVAAWAEAQARRHGRFTVEPVDLAAVNLPLFDEPEHPRLARYHHDHTKAWSAIVDRADAFVFVTPEYNYSAPPSLVNALDYLSREWAYKAVGFVSYGGVSGGVRAVQMVKQTVTTLRMVPVVEAVAFPFFARSIVDGVFTPDPAQEKAATAMLDELARWTDALAALRPPRPG
jgi:NAD(P)H-dependent FMN reductase